MFIKKAVLPLKSSKKNFDLKNFSEYDLSDDGVAAFGKTRHCYNFATSDGALKKGHGFKKLTLPMEYDPPYQDMDVEIDFKKVMGMWQYVWYDKTANLDKYYLFILDENLKMYMLSIFSDDKYLFETKAQFTEIPYSASFSKVDGNDDIFFSSPSDKTISLNGNGYQQFDKLPKFVSACWFGPYLFMATAGYKNQLVYGTSAFGSWEEGEIKTIDLPDVRGGLTQLIALEQSLYLFREFGITRLSLYSTRSDITYSHIYYSSSYIFPKTIAKNGDQILFVSKEGLFSLEGESVKKIDLPIEKDIDFENYSSCGVCFEGKYYLACKYNFSSEVNDGENNALLIYDIENKTFELVKGFDIRSMTAIQTPKYSKLCAVFRGENENCIGQLTDDGKFFGKDLPKFWVSSWTDFGFSMQDKVITELNFRPNIEADVTIKSDLDEKKLKVPYSSKPQRFRTNVFGKQFQISIETTSSKQIVSKPQIKVKVLG